MRHFKEHLREHMFHGRGGGRHGFFGGRGRGGGGGGFFGGFMGGPGMRAAKMLASGDLQLVILSLLNEKPRHGYEVIKALEDHSSGVYTPSPGMVYPALTYLEEMGFAEASTEGNKKQFKITAAGTEHLQKNQSEVEAIMQGLSQYGQKIAWFQQQMAQDEASEEKWGESPRHQHKQEWRQLKTEFRDLKHDLKAAIFEKINASFEEKQRVLDVLRKAIAEIRGGASADGDKKSE